MNGLNNLNRQNSLLARLKSEVLAMQGQRAPLAGRRIEKVGLGPIEAAFPHEVFPTAGMHEFTSTAAENAAATSGFIAAVAGNLMKQNGICIWISTKRTVYPLALIQFGIVPDRVIFIDLKKEKDLLWTIEEALKCKGLAAVVGEVQDLNLTESRRLQLAVEESRITGFLHRVSPRTKNPISALCRWQILPLAGAATNGLPGLGYPQWEVQIEKVRNGRPGKWYVQWTQDHFEFINKTGVSLASYHSKVG